MNALITLLVTPVAVCVSIKGNNPLQTSLCGHDGECIEPTVFRYTPFAQKEALRGYDVVILGGLFALGNSIDAHGNGKRVKEG